MLCLAAATDDAWAQAAVREIDVLLADHAHCEQKAASNARSLAARFPMARRVREALLEIAREEDHHFEEVTRLLAVRGARLGPPRVDGYAAGLRRASARLPNRRTPLVDRLLVGALIEARSCERFKLLAEALPTSSDDDAHRLADFYAELFACEARHYRTFVDLASEAAAPACDEAYVAVRLSLLARFEAGLVHSLVTRATRASIHG